MRPLRTETDEAKKAEIKKKIVGESIPKFLERILRELEGNDGKYLVGKQLSWVDFVFAHYISQFDAFLPGQVTLPGGIKTYVDSIFSIPQIKKWVEMRPVTTL